MAVIQFVRKPRRRVVGYLPMPDGRVLRFTGRTARDVVRQWETICELMRGDMSGNWGMLLK